jgi:hypothetical protein
MSNERELKQHVRWLEDQLDRSVNIEGQLDEISNAHDRLDEMGNILKDTVGVLKKQSYILKELVAALQGIGSAIKEGVAKQSAAPVMQSVFDQLLNDLTKRPKRQKFKPKVVNSDQPDEPGAA